MQGEKKKEQKAMGKGGGKRRQEPTPSGRERRACQLALGSSQPSGGAVGAGFPPWEERMEPHPAPGCAGGCAGGGWCRGSALGGMRALPGEMDAPPAGRGCERSSERGCTPGALRVFLGEADAPRGGCRRSSGRECRFSKGWMDAPREGVNAPPSPQPDPATSALLRGAHERLGMSKASQPRPPCAGARCSRTRVGSGSPGGAGLGAAVWAGMVPAGLPPQTSLCWAGRARSCGGRALRAVSTGTGCLTCTSHAKASLLFAFLPLCLLQLSPSRRDAAASRSAFPHPRGFPGASSPRPLGCHLCREPGWGVKGSGVPRRGVKLHLSLSSLLLPRICASFILLFRLLFFNACFGAPGLASLQSYSMPLVIHPSCFLSLLLSKLPDQKVVGVFFYYYFFIYYFYNSPGQQSSGEECAASLNPKFPNSLPCRNLMWVPEVPESLLE